MSTLGYVVIEYNQASRRPDLMDGFMLDSVADATEEMRRAENDTRQSGRGETYAIARIELVAEA